jgi:hypothetical protein
MSTAPRSTMFVVEVPTSTGTWIVRWPDTGKPRRFRSRAAAQLCALHLPVASCAGARVVPVTKVMK